MKRRKKFIEPSELPIYEQIQNSLPDAFKLQVVTCWQANQPLSAHICAALGDTAVSLCGATSREGREFGSSYVMDWSTIEWLKEAGYRWYDLGGAGDPLVTEYKLGLAGRKAEIITAIGKYDSGPSALRHAVQLAERARILGHRIRAASAPKARPR